MQPIDKHIDLIVIKFHNAKGYSEVSQDRLRASIRDYLLNFHDEEMESLAAQMELEQLANKPIDQEFYKKNYKQIKNKLDDRIKELGYMGESETQKLLT